MRGSQLPTSGADDSAPEMRSRTGQVIAGRYRLLAEIGRGGMGGVYRGEHIELRRPVAVKVLEPQAHVPHARERFVREARATASLRHPNIVDVLDVGHTEDGEVFIVMELLEGEDLAVLLDREGPMSWSRAQHFLRQICRGLGKAHAAGVVHRDLKLENCFVTEGDVVKIVDFGIAKTMSADSTRLTGVGSVMGTPDYMSPEQARGKEVDHRSDIYSVGIIAYELLTGATPFTGDNPMDVIMQHVRDPVPPPSKRNPAISPLVEQLVLTALAKAPGDRFGSMADFERAMAGAEPQLTSYPAVTGPINLSVSQPVRAVSASQSVVRPRSVAWMVAATATALFAVVGAGAYVLWSTPESHTSTADEAAPPIVQAEHEVEGVKVSPTRMAPSVDPGTTVPPPNTPDEVVAPPTRASGAGTADVPPESEAPVSKPNTTSKSTPSRPQLDAKTASAALEKLRPYFKTCIGRFTGGKAGDRVRLRLTVSANTGRVLSAKAMGTHSATTAGKCVADIAIRAKVRAFGKGKARVNVTYVL